MIDLSAFWGALDFWGRLFLIATACTWAYGVADMLPRRGRQHVWGAEILGLSLIATHVIEWQLGKSPPAAFAILDTVTAALFFWQMERRKAAWAAICVLMFFFMGVTHVSFVLSGQMSGIAYHRYLDWLYGASLLTILTAIIAGRHEWGTSLDYGIHRLRRGWTFSGVRVLRCAPPSREV